MNLWSFIIKVPNIAMHMPFPESHGRQCGRVDQGKEVELSASVSVLPAFPFQSYSLEDMQRLQLEDASINPVYQAARHGQIPPLDVSKTWSRESRLLQMWQHLCIKNMQCAVETD